MISLGSEALERRASILRTHDALLATLREVSAHDRAGATDPELVRLEKEIFWRAEELRREYLALLPRVAISRCPHTGDVLEMRIDTVDIDGLWWDHATPVRALDPRPRTFLALTGALALRGDPPWTRFLVKPGPEVPYVLPRLLARDGVKATLSSLRIGPHDAYAVAYYAAPGTSVPEARPNEWGGSACVVVNEAGERRWDSEPEDPTEHDHDLAPWVERGKLAWIAPGDLSLQVRTGVTGCPYLGLPGRRDLVRIEEGAVR